MAIMKISDVSNRQIPAQPWTDGEKIPWNEPGFSKRMLKEHLSQDHDAASRRLEIVNQQVEYCEQLLRGETGSRVSSIWRADRVYTLTSLHGAATAHPESTSHRRRLNGQIRPL